MHFIDEKNLEIERQELHHYECEFKNTNQGIEVKIVCKE